MSAYALPGLFPPLPSIARKDVAPAFDSSFSCPSPAGECSNSSAVVLAESREDFPLLKNDNINENSRYPSSSSSSSHVGISVKDGKINSALLVQSMANGDSSSNLSPRSRRRLRKRCEETTNSEEEAIQFELSVTFGERKYIAVRSWPSICKFRKDLIRSLRTGDIPELPTLHEPGVLARSFSFLHQLVKSYAPTLEGWLKTVADLVPHDNPILSHFLYEADEDYENKEWNPALVKELEQRVSATSLDAIDETECDEEDEE